MPLEISRARADDAHKYAEAYVAVFFDEALHARVYLDMPYDVQIERTAKIWSGFCNSPTSFTQVVTDTDTGEVIAFAVWTIVNADFLVEKLKGPEADESSPTVPSVGLVEGIDTELRDGYLSLCEAKKAIHMGDRPMMRKNLPYHRREVQPAVMASMLISPPDLNLLGTKPQHLRRGAGRMLLQWMNDFTDREGVYCYVESTEVGKPVYEKSDYVMKDTIEMSWEGLENPPYVQYCLAREPRGTGE